MSIDYQIFRVINSLSGQTAVMDFVSIFLATYLIFALVLAVLIYIWRVSPGSKSRLLVRVLLAVAGAYFLNQIISLIYFRPRPFVSQTVNTLISVSAQDKSFPSDHAAVAWAMAVSIFLINKKIGWIFIILAFFISLSRVSVGVHYPADIVAGAVIGSFFAWLAKKLYHDYSVFPH